MFLKIACNNRAMGKSLNRTNSAWTSKVFQTLHIGMIRKVLDQTGDEILMIKIDFKFNTQLRSMGQVHSPVACAFTVAAGEVTWPGRHKGWLYRLK